MVVREEMSEVGTKEESIVEDGRGFRWHRTGTSAAATSGCKETATHRAAGAAQVEL